MKLIKNPLNVKIEIIFKAPNVESLEPGEERLVHDELASFWKRIHSFLIVSESNNVKEVVEEPKEVESDEVVEEKEEEVKEEVEEEKPKKSKKSKKSSK